MKRVGIARWAAVTVGLLSFALAGCQSTGTSESDSSAQTGSEFDQGAGDTRDGFTTNRVDKRICTATSEGLNELRERVHARCSRYGRR